MVADSLGLNISLSPVCAGRYLSHEEVSGCRRFLKLKH